MKKLVLLFVIFFSLDVTLAMDSVFLQKQNQKSIYQSSETLELREDSHSALFNYFLPTETLGTAINSDVLKALNSHLFKVFSQNSSLAMFHLSPGFNFLFNKKILCYG